MAFYKYSDSPTYYGDVGGTTYAFADEASFKKAGGDFNTAQTFNQATPDLVKNAPIYGQTASPGFGSTANTSNNTSIVNSADQVYNNVENLGSDIQKTQSGGVYLADLLKRLEPKPLDTSASDAYNKFLTDRQTQLEDRRKEEIARLTSSYGAESSKKEAKFAEEIRPLERKLGLLGDVPYGRNAGVQEQLQLQFTNLQNIHKAELDSLFQQREYGISQANNAFADQDFALAERQLGNVKDTEKEMYARQQDYINLALNVYGQQRKDAQEEYQKQQDAQKFLSENGITGQFYMYPGSSAVYSSQNPGVVLSYEQYKALGGQGKLGSDAFPDVQTVQGASPDYGPQYKEWLGYLAQGGTLGYPEYQNMDANRKRSVSNTTITDATGQFNLLLKQAPGSVAALKEQGYSWQAIAQMMTDQGIDPGIPEIDDALHRAFQTQPEYEIWKADESMRKKGIYEVSRTDNGKGQVIIYYSDGTRRTVDK